MRSWTRLLLAAAMAVLAVTSCVYPDASQGADRLLEGASRSAPLEADGGVEQDAGEPAPTGDASAERPACRATFGKEILPAFVELGCTSIACHGTRLSASPRLEAKDAELTYKALVGYAIGVKPYVKPGGTVPEESALHCHLRGQCGKRMPPNGEAIPKSLLDAVDDWLACGAPSN